MRPSQKTPGLRLVPDNFYGVEQAVIVPKGEAARLAIVESFIDEARASGLIADCDRARRTRRRRRRAGEVRAERKMQSGTAPKHDPAIRFLPARGGDDCAPAGCRRIPPRARRFGQVNNM